jgi:hypothetical protein
MTEAKHQASFSSLKVSKRFIFTAWAGSMIIFIIGVILWCSLFLAGKLNEAFSPKETPAPPDTVRFDIKGYEQLHLSQ